MAIHGSTARRAVSALAVVTLAAALLAGLWGGTVRAEVCASVAPAAATSGPPVAVRDPVGDPAAVGGRAFAGTATDAVQVAVASALAPLAAGRPANSVSVAALDTKTGTRVGWGAGSGMTIASVFKLLLLEAYLLQNQDRGEVPGDGDAGALAAMIESSDNGAANQVYAAVGGQTGVAAALTRLGVSGTKLDPENHWGLSTTGAADQLTALTDLVSSESPLSSASRACALGLMRDVQPDQRWGVGAAADPDTDFANKNGWLDVDDDGGRWVASSVGVIEVGGHQVLLAVLTQHDADLHDGIDLVETVSRTVGTTLRNAATPAHPVFPASDQAPGEADRDPQAGGGN